MFEIALHVFESVLMLSSLCKESAYGLPIIDGEMILLKNYAANGRSSIWMILLQ